MAEGQAHGKAHDPLGIVGTTISDKYVIEKVVGEGGFGIVYRAKHKIWNQPVAIKCFKALAELNADARENLLKDFIQEGALLSQLSGRTASIVQARDVGTFTTEGGTWVPYMVLEWLEGRTLEAIVEEQRASGSARWPAELAIGVLEPVAQALDLVHRRNIAHRDIKPANIIISGDLGTQDMLVKVLDFGIAKVVQHMAEQASFTKTSGAITSFTPGYGAPEQFSRARGATGPWTDVYALALVLTELLAGTPPLTGEDFIQLGMTTADPNRRPTPRALGADVSDALEATIAKALAVKPQDRFPTAGEFWNGVRAAMHMSMMPSQTQPSSGVPAVNTVPGATPFVSAPPGISTGPAPITRPGFGPPAPGFVAAPTVAVTGPDPSASSRLPEVPVVAPAASGNTSQPVERVPQSSNPAAGPRRSSALPAIAIAAVAAIGAGGFFFFRGSTAPPPTPPPSQAAGARQGGAEPAARPPGATTPAAVVASAAPVPAACPKGMVRIEGGKFYMGSDDPDASPDERPAHQVVLSPFCIDRNEVTMADYKACSDQGECKRAPSEVWWKGIEPREKKAFSAACNANDPAGRSEHPVNCVDWEMANHYCEAQKARLPTEAEWEFAARGPDGRRYPWGDESPDKTRMNACGKECLAWGTKQGVAMGLHGKGMYDDDDGFPLTAPVGSFPAGASRYGLLDVVGNVWEWTSDWQGPYRADQETDPKGPAAGERRVVRGGAFNGALPSWVRPTQRYADDPKAHSHAYGFRCAKSL